MADSITDTGFASGPQGEAEAMPTVPWHEVEAAAREVVNAAVLARRKEFVEEDEKDVFGRVESINLVDRATGDVYEYRVGEWVNRATGAVGDPRDVDPSQYQWVLDTFVYFYERWPSYPAAMAAECDRAKKAIEAGPMSDLLAVDQIVWNGWGGDAQRHFTQFFMDPFVQIAVTNQQRVLEELAVAMYAYEALLKQAAVDAKHAADETVKRLDALDDSNPGDAAIAIQVGLAVVGVLVAVASGGTALPVTVGLIAAGLDGAAAVVMGIEQQKEQDLNGGTVEEVLTRLRAGLDELKRHMDTIEQNLANQVTEAAGQVDGWLASNDPLTKASILPNEPDDDEILNVTDSQVTGGDDFRPRH